MKKGIVTILLAIAIILPVSVFAKEYKSQNLEEILTTKGIEHDLKNYKETDDQVPIYLFYGSTCGYCNSFINFLNSIVDDYGKYFKLVAYEVWNNSDNATLMKDVANFLGEKASGVPYIVIGDKTFVGYDTPYDEDIKSAITSLYNSKDRYDVFKKMEENEKEDTKSTTSVSTPVIIICNLLFTIGAVVVAIVYEESKFKTLNSKLTLIENKLETKKGK